MTRTLAFEMLAQGNTGADILQILDVIQQDTDSSANLVENETSITVEFWYLLWVLYVLHMGFLMCNTQVHSGWHIGGTCGRMTVLWIWQWFMGVSVGVWGG